MTRGQRVVLFGLAGVLTGVLLAIIVLVFVARSDFAAERVRTYAVKWLDDRVEGTIKISRFRSGGLLTGITLEDFSIIDPYGRPFLSTDSARLKYDFRTLLGGTIQLDEVTLYDPHIVIEQLPKDTLWNYQLVFPDRTPGKPKVRKLIQFDRVRVINGVATIGMPFRPDGPIQVVDTARFAMEKVDGGQLKVFRFDSLNAELSRVLWESPIEEGKKFDVKQLSTRAFIFRDPVRIRNATGEVSTRDTVTAFRMTQVSFGGSQAEIEGNVTRIEGKKNLFNIIIDGRRLNFRDLQWAYPAVPDSGFVVGQLAIRTQRPKGMLWYVSNARISAPGTQMAGNFGVVTGDTLYFTDVDLRASPLNLELLEKILPGKLPVKGLLVGTVEVKGPLSSLDTKGDLKLTQPDGATPTTLRFAGIFDARSDLSATKFQADVTSLDLALLNALRPDLQLRGVVNGRIEADGVFADRFNFAAALQHELAGLSSRFEGSGTYDTRGKLLDLRMNAIPLSLEELASAYPALKSLRGEARGPINLSGPIDNLAVDARLATGGGELRFNGKLQQVAGRRRYSGHGRLEGFQLDRLLYEVPPSNVSGNVQFDLTGSSPSDARGNISLELSSGRFSGVQVRDARVAARVQDGVMIVDSMRARTALGALTAAGSLGITETALGALRFDIATDSIVPLDDSVRSTLTGSLAARGTLIGGIRGFDLTAEGNLRSLLWGGANAKRSFVQVQAHGLATDSMRIDLSATLDSAVIMGEPIDSARARLEYQMGAGRLDLNAGGSDRLYRLAGSIAHDSSATRIGVEELRLGEADSPWTLSKPFGVAWNGRNVQLDTFALTKAGRDGSILGAGTLAFARSKTESSVAQEPIDFGLTLRALPFSEFMHIVRADHAITGSTDGSVRITGTAGEPIVQADATVTNLRYADARVDVMSASFAYANRRAHGRIDARYGDRTILLGDGAVPINLAFVPVKQRKLDEPLEFSFRADSMPAALLAGTVGGFDDVRGSVSGTLQLHGTTVDPSIAGLLNLREASGIYAASGVRYRNVNGSFRVLDDSLVAVEASARAAEGNATLNGRLNFAQLTNPKFDSLFIDAREFQTANRRDAEFTTSGRVLLTGSYRSPVLSGDIRVDHGSLNLDELYRQYLVIDLDRALLFNVVDTSIVADRKLLPVNYKRSPFIKNLRVTDFNVDVQRDAWLRSRNMNVEVSGQLKLIFVPCVSFSTTGGCADGNVDLRILGELTAIRGTYTMASTLVSRRFDVREGTVEFPGTPGMDPNLSFTALHRARPLQGDVIDIIALVSGTLQNPRVRLASAEGQPQMSESDLASYLFFGLPTNMLTSVQSNQLGAFGLNGRVGVAANALFNSTYGFLSSGLESFAQSIGVADYVSLTAEETSSAAARPGLGFNQFFANTRLEVGRYLVNGNQNFFAVVSKPLNTASGLPGLRVEWRFGPTYTLEFFGEDRNARAATTFGIEQTVSYGKVFGFFLFREWGR